MMIERMKAEGMTVVFNSLTHVVEQAADDVIGRANAMVALDREHPIQA